MKLVNYLKQDFNINETYSSLLFLTTFFSRKYKNYARNVIPTTISSFLTHGYNYNKKIIPYVLFIDQLNICIGFYSVLHKKGYKIGYKKRLEILILILIFIPTHILKFYNKKNISIVELYLVFRIILNLKQYKNTIDVIAIIIIIITTLYYIVYLNYIDLKLLKKNKYLYYISTWVWHILVTISIHLTNLSTYSKID